MTEHYTPGSLSEQASLCTTCGYGRRGSSPIMGPNSCGYCGDDFPEGEHRHKLGSRIDGLAKCKGAKHLGCTFENYDSQWGAGIFNDWEAGHHKAYGA